MQEQDTQTRKQRQDVVSRGNFHRMMQQRRKFNRGSLEWEWRTEAAFIYLLMTRNVPADQWHKLKAEWKGKKQ